MVVELTGSIALSTNKYYFTSLFFACSKKACHFKEGNRIAYEF
jgi:hypothetical protein